MIRIRTRAILIIITSTLSTLGCVSVDLAKPSVMRSEAIKFNEPTSKYEERESQHLDKLWINEKNGNSISFFSDCNNRVDPPLKKIREGVLKGLEDKKILFEKKQPYNRRKSLRTTVLGSVDGIKTKLDLVVFKKNSCIYIITYGAVATKFTEDAKDFSKFLEGFRVP